MRIRDERSALGRWIRLNAHKRLRIEPLDGRGVLRNGLPSGPPGRQSSLLPRGPKSVEIAASRLIAGASYRRESTYRCRFLSRRRRSGGGRVRSLAMPEWTIEKCGWDDRVGVYDLLVRSFFKDEPLTYDLTWHPPMDEMFAIKMLSQGHSYKAVLPSGKIVGVVINVNFAELADNVEDDKPPTSGRIQQVVDFFDHVDKLARLDETGLLELFAITVDPDFRQQGLAKALGQASLKHAEDQGYSGMKIACTSKYSADMAVALGFKLIFSLAYADYRDDNGKQIFTPPAPHTHTRVLVKRFQTNPLNGS